MGYFFLLILIFSYLFVRFFHNWRPDPWPTNHFNLPKWQIHRGYCLNGLQENTLEAFRESNRLGYKMIELDVQLSKDGIPVVFHDNNLERISGRKERVSELNAEELKKLANAPSLEEVLMDPKIPPYINIEIKNRSATDHSVAYAVSKVVKKQNAMSRIIFSSFNPLSLRILWKELPNVPRALLATDDRSDPDSRIYLRKLWLGGIAHANMLNLDKKMINSNLLKRLNERNIPIAAWTVNDSSMAEVLLNKGLVSIISDTADTIPSF